jgi:hypothetical protein
VCFITPLVGSVDSSHVLIACSFASVGFFGNNKSSTQTHESLSGKFRITWFDSEKSVIFAFLCGTGLKSPRLFKFLSIELPYYTVILGSLF